MGRIAGNRSKDTARLTSTRLQARSIGQLIPSHFPTVCWEAALEPAPEKTLCAAGTRDSNRSFGD